MVSKYKYLWLSFTAIVAAILLFADCSSRSAGFSAERYASLAEDVAYAGMETCRSCHANVHETFVETGMGLSFDLATPDKSAARFGPHALVYHEATDLYYKPFFKDSSMFVLEFRLQGRDTVHKRLEKISYIVGSGQHTNSHILDINGYLYQAPITYYTQKETWDMAPGFQGENLRFSRFLTTECISCHNHYPEHVKGSLNKFADMPRGIECERCHGPGGVHVREKLAGKIVDTSRYIDYTIVNPADLPRDRQMDLCQRCHLQGVAVLEEGKTFFDFKPGMRLSEVMNVFLPRYSNTHEQFIMASQADRLRMSPCYQQSANLTCITCHHPHHSVKSTDSNQFNKACLSCHQKNDGDGCSLSMAERAGDNDCSGCHMPASGSIDIPHVNITDHYISKATARRSDSTSRENPGEPAKFLGLEILTKPQPAPLDMARGYLALFDKYVQTPQMLDSAYWYLQRSEAPLRQKLASAVHYHFAREDFSGVIQLAQQSSPPAISDAWTAYRIGESFYKKGNFRKALNFYERAAELMPLQLDFLEKLGACYVQLKELTAARQTFEQIILENPKRPVALSNLGYVNVLQGRLETAEAFYDQAITLDPDYEQALLNKAAVRLLQKDPETGKRLVRRVLAINPQNEQALSLRAAL